MNVDLQALSDAVDRYQSTHKQSDLVIVYEGFKVLCAHTLNKQLKITGAFINDSEDVVTDATTRLIMRIIQNADYRILPEHWLSKARFEVIHILYNKKRQLHDRVISLEELE